MVIGKKLDVPPVVPTLVAPSSSPEQANKNKETASMKIRPIFLKKTFINVIF